MMRAMLAAAMVIGAAWYGGAAASETALREWTAETFAQAHQINAYATEAALNGTVFRFVGTPIAVQRGPDGLPRVTYAVGAAPWRVQAQIAKEAEGIAAKIRPDVPLTLICTGAADGMMFPYVTGCRAAGP